MSTMLYNLTNKGSSFKDVQLNLKPLWMMLYVVYSNIVPHIVQQTWIIVQHCTICTILYNTLYNILFKPIFRLYNFSSCLWSTTFCTILYNLCTMLYNIVQVVQVVQPFVQYCNCLVCRCVCFFLNIFPKF